MKQQLEEAKRDLTTLREHYDRAQKEQESIAKYKLEQERTHYEKVVQEKEAKTLELQRDLENERAYNEHVANSYKAHTIAVLERGNIREDDRQAESSLNASILHDPEYLAQKNKWTQMESEAEVLKTNIRMALVPTDPMGFQSMPDRISGTPFYPHKLRDQMLYSPVLYKKMAEEPGKPDNEELNRRVTQPERARVEERPKYEKAESPEKDKENMAVAPEYRAGEENAAGFDVEARAEEGIPAETKDEPEEEIQEVSANEGEELQKHEKQASSGAEELEYPAEFSEAKEESKEQEEAENKRFQVTEEKAGKKSPKQKQIETEKGKEEDILDVRSMLLIEPYRC